MYYINQKNKLYVAWMLLMYLKPTVFPRNRRCYSCTMTCIWIHNTKGKFWEDIGCQHLFVWKLRFWEVEWCCDKVALIFSVNKGLYLLYPFFRKRGPPLLRWYINLAQFYYEILWNLKNASWPDARLWKTCQMSTLHTALLSVSLSWNSRSST